MSNAAKHRNGPASDDTTSTTATTSTPDQRRRDGGAAEQRDVVADDDTTKKGTKKTLWVTVFKCFYCGKQGHNLPKCRQCSQAYYCDADCQRKHWKRHKPVCRAAVAALARHAHRQRVARAVREKGGAEEGAKEEKEEEEDEDKLCVICQDKPVNPVEVSLLCLMGREG